MKRRETNSPKLEYLNLMRREVVPWMLQSYPHGLRAQGRIAHQLHAMP